MSEKNILGEAGISLADLEGSHNEILSRIARELAQAEDVEASGSHYSHSSSSGGGHYSYSSATGPSKVQTKDEPTV